MIWKAALVALFAFVVALVVFAMSQPSYGPQQKSYNQSSQHSTQSSGGNDSVTESLWHRIWRSTLNEPINLFTLILAISTTALFVAGVVQIAYLIRAERTAAKTANAAQQSADAIANVERPYIFISAKPVANVPKEGPYIPNPKIAYVLHNLGRVPAIVTLVYAECTIVNNLDLTPTWDPKNFKQALRAIASGQNDADIPSCEFDNPITDEDWSAIKVGHKFALFKGVFVYEGALDFTYVTSVGYMINLFEGGAVAVGGSIYNYGETDRGRASEKGQLTFQKLKFTPQGPVTPQAAPSQK